MNGTCCKRHPLLPVWCDLTYGHVGPHKDFYPYESDEVRNQWTNKPLTKWQRLLQWLFCRSLERSI